MFYAEANELESSRQFIDAFGGFNHAMRINDNEFYETRNMSSCNYPLLSSCDIYKNLTLNTNDRIIRGICCNDEKIWYVYEDGTTLKLDYVDNEGNAYSLGTTISDNRKKERTLINLGAYIIIFPDKMFFNTADVTDYGSMEKVFRNIDEAEHYNRWYVVKPCDREGNEYVADFYGAAEPDTDNIADGYVWYDTKETVIKVWTKNYSMWLTPTIYHKYRIQGIGIFKEGDGVKLRRYIENNEYVTTTAIVKAYSNGDAPIGDTPPLNADYIIIPATDDVKINWNSWQQATTNAVLYNQWRNLISVEQKTPVLDYVCESQGRLWGCRYGDTTVSELRQYRKHYDTLPTTDYIDIIGDFANGETLGAYLTYWAYNNDFDHITSGVTVSVVNSGAPEGTHYPCIKVEVTTYTGTLNINVNYTVNKTQKLNEIYASKQQDFKSWDYYQGTALDSYTVSIGASGKFTGCVNFNGKPLFSKEDRFYLIYGSYPAQYQLSENVFEGVENGAYKSMAVYNGVLYYKGRHGIYAYSGGLPSKIDKFGGLIFESNLALWGNTTDSVMGRTSCATAYNGIYYIYLTGSGHAGLYRYDIDKGIWNVSTTGTILQMIPFNASLGTGVITRKTGVCAYSVGVYVDTQHPLNTVFTDLNAIEDKSASSSSTTSWRAETGTLGLSSPDEKYIKKITIRYKGSATIKINYDSETNTQTGNPVWKTVVSVSGGTKSQTYSMNPPRCDHFRLRFEGSGEFYLYSIAITTETGSDVNNG